MHALRLSNRLCRTSARSFASHTPGLKSILEKKPDDVVITFAKRTAMGRAKKGQFKDMPIDELLAKLLKASFEVTKLNPAEIDDIAVGVSHPPSPLYLSRAGAFAAGVPAHVPIHTINRLCSSGLMAIRSIAQSIKAGDATLGVALGVESMSLNPRPTPEIAASTDQNSQAHDCVQPMGWTSEMVAQEYGVSREKQDKYALISHTRASDAAKAGVFSEEIIPIPVGDLLATEDDMLRHGVTAESLAKLKPVFPDWGHALTTAGNASGVGDGAAITILATRERAQREGWDIIAKWAGCSVTGVEPKFMGVGPVVAIPKILSQIGLRKEDVDVWEINEAFASQFAYCVETLDIPMDKVNPNGGSIALSHPIGMTGVRLAVTGLAELKRRDAKVLCTSMCVGSGMGAAAIFVNEARR